MTLQASGAISMSQIRGEFGGSAPDTISEYYRGAGLVPDIPANSSIPTSGAISMSNFYNGTNVDVTPSAVDWTNLSGTGTGPLTTNTQTITGITTTITLEVDFAGGDFMDFIYEYRKNGGSWTMISDGGTISMANGDTLAFRVTRGSSGFDSDFFTVYNNTDGGATVDTFSITFTS